MDTDEAQARANLGNMVVEAVNEGRQVSVILAEIPERIVVTNALHEGGIIDIEDAGGIEYRALLSAVKVVILGPPDAKASSDAEASPYAPLSAEVGRRSIGSASRRLYSI